MSHLDPASDSPAALAALRAAMVAAQSAPAADTSIAVEERDDSDISTPRARASAALESALKARRDWYWARDARAGESLCNTLIEMCSWHEHPQLRDRMLALQAHGLALLEAMPATEPSMAAVEDLQDEYTRIKPRDDDAAAIAAALGLTPEEARAFGLVGTLAAVGVEESAPVPRAADGALAAAQQPAEPEETLEETFRREARLLLTRALPRALQQFWSNQRSMDTLLNVRRGYHTLKGDARVTAHTIPNNAADDLEGFAVLAEAAEDVIDLLLGDDYDNAQPAPTLPAGAFSLLQEVADVLARRLEARAPLPEEGALLQRLRAMQQRSASISGASFPEAATSTPPSTRPPSQTLTPPVAPRPPSHPLLSTFLDESGRLMADLHRALAALEQNSSDEDALVRARVKLHTIKGAAALVGEETEDIRGIAHSAEDLLELIEDFQLRGEMTTVPRAVLHGVLDAEDALQTLLDILRMQTRSGRLSSIQRLEMPPKELASLLNAIAERVRSGDISEYSSDDPNDLLQSPIISSVGPLPVLRRGTGALDPSRIGFGTGTLDPSRLGRELLGGTPRSTGTLDPSRLAATAQSMAQRAQVPEAAQSETAATPDLQSVVFADLIDRCAGKSVLPASAVTTQARVVEERAAHSSQPITIYTCVQYLSSYVQDLPRYRNLASKRHTIYVFGKPDIAPPVVEGVIIIPLASADALSTERLVLLDSKQAPVGFFARPDQSDRPALEPSYLCAGTEDPALVREAIRRLRLALQRDTALIEARRADLLLAPQPAPAARSAAAPALPLKRSQPAPAESNPQEGVKAALEVLEDLSVKRDALQGLISRMTRQGTERRRSTRRLRALVERVGLELADLRSELVRTTGRTGDWDLLEKEEYTSVDVLLMQLDEALADLEESDNMLRRDLGEAQAQMESQSDTQLRAQRALLNVSMVPLSQIEDRMAFAVRSQSRRLNKQVRFALEGADLLIDGRIAEQLFDPLMHLINNAIDHGIEDLSSERLAAGKPAEGLVLVRGRAAGDGVLIEVIDDGRGIDPARLAEAAVERGILTEEEAANLDDEGRIALIWRTGFTTARSVSTVSGRGIGMTSVRDDISSLQGHIEVASESGRGATFSLRLPRSLAMLRVEVVREGRDLVAVPITQLAATHVVSYAGLEQRRRDGSVQVVADGRSLQIYAAHLASGPIGDGDAGHGVLLEVLDRPGGLLVDEVLGSQYLPIRPAVPYLRHSCAVLGYAIGGGGRILPIVDVAQLLDRAVREIPSLVRPRVERPAATVLVVDDSPTMRRALSDTLSRAGFQVQTASDGRDALEACTRTMPALITLDMEMPGMDGLEALSALRVLPNGAHVPVFMITSRQQARHRAAALAAGVTRYFTKPYDSDELVHAAREIIDVAFGAVTGEAVV